jgi:succinoglycan biosynthesis transport protein ExoP
MQLNPPDPHPDYQALGPAAEAAPSASPLGLSRLLVFLLKYWWIPALTSMLGGVAAFVYLRSAPSTFVSSASMWETEKLRLPEGNLFSGDMQNYLGTQVELLRSGELAQLVFQRLQASGKNAIPRDKEGKLIQAQVSILEVPKSSILIVQTSSEDAAYSQTYLTALLNEYLDFKKNLRKSVSDYTLASLSEEVTRLEHELNEQQEAFTAFERSNNLAILQEEGTHAAGYLAKLYTELSDSQLELKLLEANATNEIQKPNPGKSGTEMTEATPDTFAGQSQSSAGGVNDERRAATREIEMLKMERDRLSRFLKDKHPKMVKLNQEIEKADKLNQIFRKQDQKQLEASRLVLQSRVENLQASVRDWEAKVMKASSNIAEADSLKIKVNHVQAEHDRYLAMLQNIDISRNIDQEPLSILQPATPATRSLKKEGQKAASFVLGGLLLGVGIVLLIAWRDDRFTSFTEMSDKFGDVIVGQVPELVQPKGQSSVLQLQAQEDQPMYAESYRSLRSALLFLPQSADRPKVILVTSAIPGEGKSTIASNLARTMALGGSRVVLIDADLRRGHLHEILQMKREPGLTDLLQHPEDFNKILQSNCTPNLWFISRGWTVSRPGDLFVGAALENLLARLRKEFDSVVIDTSPVFAADDVTTLAPRADGTLFVVRTGVSRSSVVAEALAVLSRRQVNLLGIVVNGARSNSKSYNYYKCTEYYQPTVGNDEKPFGDAGNVKPSGPA